MMVARTCKASIGLLLCASIVSGIAKLEASHLVCLLGRIRFVKRVMEGCCVPPAALIGPQLSPSSVQPVEGAHTSASPKAKEGVLHNQPVFVNTCSTLINLRLRLHKPRTL